MEQNVAGSNLALCLDFFFDLLKFSSSRRMSVHNEIRCKPQAPPTSGVGRASGHIDLVRKSPFYASLWQVTAPDRRLAVASHVRSVK